ncbi:MAG: ABC transporter substrate-binding protein [Alphaproteobacteria bacterium]|nr:ABC transporter substrate-binding protein [Alphaproteobacteria bacterium]
MDRRSVLKLAAGAAAAAPLSALNLRRAIAQGAAGRPITYGQSTSLTALDPGQGGFLNYPAGYEAALCLYDRLIDFDENLRFVPQLAESWQIADDLKSIRFVLRRGAKFHDGTPIDAAAVKFNIERTMDRQRTPTNRPIWDPITAVEAPDDRTVIARTTTPFSQLLNIFAHGSAAMVSPTAIQRNGERSIAQNPVGSGPFMLESFNPGQQLIVKAFDDYWGGKPATPRITFQFIAEAATRVSALRTGSVDVIDAVPVQLIQSLRREQNIEVITKPGLRPMGFVINLTRAPYDNVLVRRALNFAVPVQTIAERVFFGFARASDSPLAFNTRDYRKAGDPVFDAARARALLAEAGWRDMVNNVLHKDGQPLKMTLQTSEGLFPGDVAVTEIAARAWQQIGIDVTINKIDRSAYWDTLRQERANLRFDLAMFGFNPSNASGLYHLESLFKSNADDNARLDVWNIGRYRNARVDELLRTANVTPDPARQTDLLGEAQRIIWEDAPYVWLQVNENATAIKRGVSGVELWPIVFTSVRKARG